MIFQRALLREFASLAGAVFMTLFAIALTTRLIRLLGQAAGGKIPSDAVIAFLGFFDQQFKPWSPCIEVQPGDQLVTTCDYTNNFNFDVTGGEATNNEMCTTFMEYFPRLPAAANNFCGTIDSSGGFGMIGM